MDQKFGLLESLILDVTKDVKQVLAHSLQLEALKQELEEVKADLNFPAGRTFDPSY